MSNIVQVKKGPTVKTACPSLTIMEQTCCGKMFVIVCFDTTNKIANAFVRFGKSGSCASSVMGVMFSLIRGALAAGMDPSKVEATMAGNVCHAGLDNNCMNSVAKVMQAIRGGAPEEGYCFQYELTEGVEAV